MALVLGLVFGGNESKFICWLKYSQVLSSIHEFSHSASNTILHNNNARNFYVLKPSDQYYVLSHQPEYWLHSGLFRAHYLLYSLLSVTCLITRPTMMSDLESTAKSPSMLNLESRSSSQTLLYLYSNQTWFIYRHTGPQYMINWKITIIHKQTKGDRE